MATKSSILLRGGTVLSHSKDDHVIPLPNTDILIRGNVIEKIAASISAPGPNTKTIDCQGKIISPGFIDTHHHLWQSQLKGRFADDTLFDYMPKGAYIFLYSGFPRYQGLLFVTSLG